MTRLTRDSRVLRETCQAVQRKPLVIELRAHTYGLSAPERGSLGVRGRLPIHLAAGRQESR